MSPRSTSPLSTGLRAAAVLAAATTATSAHAEIAWASYDHESQFAYIVMDMPDFDQVRDTLPNSGNCYCGPASTTDLLGYVATHGFPDIDPGIPIVSWHGPLSYIEISDLMADIGSSTGTNPGGDDTDACGVGQGRLYDELLARLGDRFTVRNCLWNRSTGYAPDTAEIAYRGWQDQAVGITLWGRWAGSFSGDRWVSNTRRGGHFEAVNRAIAGGDVMRLGLRNPSSNDDADQQSEFATHWFDATRREVRIDGDTLTIDQLNGTYTSSVDTDDDGEGDFTEERMRIFEGYLSISPKSCYTWDEVTESVVRVTPNADLWSNFSAASEMVMMPGTPSMVAFGPSDLALASIVDGRIHRTSRDQRGKNPHRVIEVPFAGWTGATDLAFDSMRRLHAVGGDRLVTIDWDRGEVIGEVRLPGEGTSIAIDNGIVHVLIPEMEMVAAVNGGPNGPFVVELPMPEDAVVQADSTISMLPGGRLFLLTDGEVNPMQIVDTGFQRLWIPVPRNGDWRSITVDDNDTLCMLDRDGTVEAYKIGPNGFQRNEGHPMDRLQAGAGFTVAASTSNWTPETNAWVGGEDDFDDRAVEIDCPGDLNLDGRVDSADIGLLLGDWGASRSIADLDRSGIVDAADMGLLLGYFGDCR